MSDVDRLEVGRTAYELLQRHGRAARAYAAKLAAEAVAENADDEAKFWQAVERALTTRME
jgi:ERCC4-related helicase